MGEGICLIDRELSLQSKIALNNSVEIPSLGLGVYQSPPGEITERAAEYALSVGYRHIDTARIYGNESDVGKAIRKSGLPREEVFIATKLWNGGQGYDSALRACESSLKRLGVSYLDLYLIHWPVPRLRSESWRALVKLLKDDKCRAVGVSNFTVKHLNELANASDVVPAVNQVEFSPFLYQRDLLDYSMKHGIQLEAYSPLTQGERLNHAEIVKLAKKHRRTPAQILIRWSLQHGLVVIPKSVKPERIRENSEVFDFEIAASEMKILDSLNEDFHTCWDPTNEP